MKKTVVWATDGSAGSDAALTAALELGAFENTKLVAVHCDQRLNGRAGSWPVLADEDDLRVAIRRRVAELQEDELDIELVIRRSHHEAADIVAQVAGELDAALIVCGTRGHGALAGAFLGSFTHRLLHIAPCAVLAVPPHVLAPHEARLHEVPAGP